MRIAATLATAALLAAALAQLGCEETEPRMADMELLGVDPTAERLHDVCGSLLVFGAANDRLPRSLAELRRATGLAAAQTVDPVTGEPFVYAPAGFAASADGRRIVLLAAPEPGEDACCAISVSGWGGADETGLATSAGWAGTPTAQVVLLPASMWRKLAAAPSGGPAPGAEDAR